MVGRLGRILELPAARADTSAGKDHHEITQLGKISHNPFSNKFATGWTAKASRPNFRRWNLGEGTEMDTIRLHGCAAPLRRLSRSNLEMAGKSKLNSQVFSPLTTR
jgi:hypothetical protein